MHNFINYMDYWHYFGRKTCNLIKNWNTILVLFVNLKLYFLNLCQIVHKIVAILICIAYICSMPLKAGFLSKTYIIESLHCII